MEFEFTSKIKHFEMLFVRFKDSKQNRRVCKQVNFVILEKISSKKFSRLKYLATYIKLENDTVKCVNLLRISEKIDHP